MQRAAVPHRRGVLGAVDHLRRPPGRAARELRPELLGADGPERVVHPRDGRADDAQPHPRRGRGRRRWACRRCGRSPTAAARCRAPVVERAMGLLPDVDLVNAYGLTETSSTIAVLGPDDHRAAFASDDPAVRGAARLGRPGAAGRRALDPRPATATPVADGRARRDLGAGRAGVGGVPRRGRGRRRTAGSTPATPATSTTRATCSCTAASTT